MNPEWRPGQHLWRRNIVLYTFLLNGIKLLLTINCRISVVIHLLMYRWNAGYRWLTTSSVSKWSILYVLRLPVSSSSASLWIWHIYHIREAKSAPPTHTHRRRVQINYYCLCLISNFLIYVIISDNMYITRNLQVLCITFQLAIHVLCEYVR